MTQIVADVQCFQVYEESYVVETDEEIVVARHPEFEHVPEDTFVTMTSTARFDIFCAEFYYFFIIIIIIVIIIH